MRNSIKLICINITSIESEFKRYQDMIVLHIYLGTAVKI